VPDEDEQRVVTVDSTGVIRSWGREWQSAVGYTPDEAVGQRIDLVIPSALHMRHWRGFNTAIEGGRLQHDDGSGSWTLRTVATHKDGQLVPLRAVLELTSDADGAVNGAKGTILGRAPGWMVPIARVGLAALRLGQSVRGRSGKSS